MPKRRQLLAGVGIAVSGGLAGCSRFNQSSPSTDPEPTENNSESGSGSSGTGQEGSEADSMSITEQWRADVGLIFGTPAVTDGVAYVGSYDGNVYALDTADGSENWRLETGGKVQSSPAVANGTVYVGSDDNHVYALSESDGSEEWRFKTPYKVQSSLMHPHLCDLLRLF